MTRRDSKPQTPGTHIHESSISKLQTPKHQTQAVGFIGGYFLESFRVTVYAVFLGVGLSSVLCVPDWGTPRTPNLANGSTPTPNPTLFCNVDWGEPQTKNSPNPKPNPNLPTPAPAPQTPNIQETNLNPKLGIVGIFKGKDAPAWLPEGCVKRPNRAAGREEEKKTK